MKKLTMLLTLPLLIGLIDSLQRACQAADAEKPDLTVTQPLTDLEKHSAVQLSRLSSARLFWNDDNRIVGVSLKGRDAHNQAVALSSQLAGLRALVLVALPRNHLTDEGLAPLAGHTQLRLLSISGALVTDAGLQYLISCPALEIVILHGEFTDGATALLATLPKLKNLDVTQCRITDAGVARLASATGLQTLILNGTQITNDSMVSIAQLKKLTELYLGDTTIDDGAVEQLKSMEQLRTLFVKRTGLTQQGIQQLLQELPIDCRVIHDHGTDFGQRTPRTARTDAPATRWQMR